MPDPTPRRVPDLDAFKKWKPDAQQRALNLLREAENNRWRPFYCKNVRCNGQPHVWPHDERECPNPFGHEWENLGGAFGCKHCAVGGTLLDEWDFNHSRVDQRPPKWSDDWDTLVLRGGRGSGKTRTGAEITNRVTEITPRIILIAATGPDFRETMVEGESGILACAPPGKKPLFEPSKKKITWPNGCIGLGYSAEEPDRLRGPQSGFIWGDEPAHWPLVEKCWDNMLFGRRLKGKRGFQPKTVATSTPKPTKWMKELVADEDTIDRTVSTYANLSNLAENYRKKVLKKYENTRLGRQELYGELLEDVEGAMWSWDIIHNVDDAPPLVRIVVSVDPAGTANKRSDETGIIVLGIGHDHKIYVLADETGKYSPAGWGAKCLDAAEEWDADAIVYEKNYGGDMVLHVLESEAKRRSGVPPRFIPVTSRRGKDIRAEPIVGLYEKMEVLHVGERGTLAKLEEEQTTWVPHESPSPNRVDALVHGATELAKNVMPAAVANVNKLLANRRRGGPPHLRAV